MAEKRKAEVDAASETVQIIPLGAGQEVGRSCIILKYMGKSVMLDCGTHPGLKGSNALPLFDGSSTGWSPHDLANLDLCLVTHFHIDHCGCVPFLVGSTNYKGRVIMTHPTKVIYYTMMKDSAKTRGNNDDQVPINDQDVEKSMERISVIDFHQTLDLDGIRITAYRAGHVLGAAMFLVEIAGMRCLYTGDYSWVGDRHLPPADVPESRPDIVIIESTFGTVNHRPRREREQQFCRKVREVVTRGGRCLLPVVALGRAQELLLILEDHWKKHSELRGIPLYQTSALARRTLSVYQTFIDMMNNDIKQAFQDSNPFNFKYVQHIKSAAHFDDVGPCVVLATPSMMDSGMSRDLFEAWCEDPRNGVIIADFAVQGTLAHKLLAEPETHLSRSGQRLRVKCSVSSASFSAHADYHETASFLDELKPPHVVLVHGEREGMLSLKSSLEKNGRVLVEKGLADAERQVYMPGVLDTVEVQIPPRFRVRAVGKLAEKPLAHGRQLQGVVLQPGSQTAQGCLLVAAPELPTFTTVRPGTVRHRQAIATRRPFGELRFALEMVFEGIQGAGDIGTVEGCGPSLLRVADAVDIVHQPGRASDGEGDQVVLEWEGGPSDVFADAVIAVILQHEGPPEAMSGLEKQRWAARQEDDSEAVERIELQMLVQLLRSQFGEVEVMEESRRLWLVVDSDRVLLDHKSGKLQCVSNPQLLDRVDRSYRRFLAALHPVTLEPED